jgi:hypothetical protein
VFKHEFDFRKVARLEKRSKAEGGTVEREVEDVVQSLSKKAGRRNRQGNVVAFGSWENGVGTGGCGGKESTGEMGERDGVEEKV